jgi:hypothetical protein
MQRLPIAFLGALALVFGVLAGLARAGWNMPAVAAAQGAHHAALMIAVFFGTVIGLERAVALERPWAYAVPVLAGLGGVALLAWAPPAWPPLLVTMASAVFAATGIAVVAAQPAAFSVVLSLGGLSYCAGSVTWAASGTPQAALSWWLAFMVLTIAGERLELTRMLPLGDRARGAFFAIVALLLAGCAMASLDGTRWQVFGAALVALGGWLAWFDVARRNVSLTGLPRYIALCLLSGYGWLMVAGALGLGGAFESGHAWRDAALHALTLGFVFSMVFGHAPIILPSVAGVKVKFHGSFYLPLAALHLTLLLRVAGAFAADLRGIGALANALTLALFVAVLLVGVARGRLRSA